MTEEKSKARSKATSRRLLAFVLCNMRSSLRCSRRLLPPYLLLGKDGEEESGCGDSEETQQECRN